MLTVVNHAGFAHRLIQKEVLGVQRKNLLLKLTEKAGLPMEPVVCLPVIEIAGDCRVLIEHHSGIREYTPECICVNLNLGQVLVWGNQLTVSSMTSSQLIIHGLIFRVELIREG